MSLEPEILEFRLPRTEFDVLRFSEAEFSALPPEQKNLLWSFKVWTEKDRDEAFEAGFRHLEILIKAYGFAHWSKGYQETISIYHVEHGKRLNIDDEFCLLCVRYVGSRIVSMERVRAAHQEYLCHMQQVGGAA